MWGEIVAKDLEAVLGPAKLDLLLLIGVEVVRRGRSPIRGSKDSSTDSMDGMDRRGVHVAGGLAQVLVAGCPARPGLQQALQDDRVRVAGVVILRVRHNHEVGGALDVERRLAVVEQHEHVPSQRLWD